MGESDAQKAADQAAQEQESQLQAKLAEEKKKKDAEDARVQAQKVKTIKAQTGAGSGLFGGGDTLG